MPHSLCAIVYSKSFGARYIIEDNTGPGYEMDTKVANTELFERLRQQHESIEERLACAATRIGSVLDRLAAALALDDNGEAENGPDASRAALATSEPAASGATPSPESADAVPMVLELSQETSQPAVSTAGAGSDR